MEDFEVQNEDEEDEEVRQLEVHDYEHDHVHHTVKFGVRLHRQDQYQFYGVE